MNSGVLLVNKPSGPTSYDMIRWIKRSLKNTKIGHAGTLDPLASGLLIVLLGRMTKQQAEFMQMEKTYFFRIRLGVQTDSADIMGKVIREMPIPSLDETVVKACLQKFTGDQLQVPPMFSALKKEGTPLYKLARQGQVIERPARPIKIYALDYVGMSEGKLEFRTRCSAGTYVRTLAEDISATLGTCGTVEVLTREKIGSYSYTMALPGERLKDLSANEIWAQTQPGLVS